VGFVEKRGVNNLGKISKKPGKQPSGSRGMGFSKQKRRMDLKSDSLYAVFTLYGMDGSLHTSAPAARNS